jgi:hypothetical protein
VNLYFKWCKTNSLLQWKPIDISLREATVEAVVTCARGQANPSAKTRIRLFADSAGYCQNPACTRQLFVETSSGEAIHFAEMAHIFAASDDGPRSNASLNEAERGAYDNLIMLCANCHTMIDKAPDDYPDTLISRWKRDRADRLTALFGAVRLSSRDEVHAAIEPLMTTNRATLEHYGPSSGAQFDPESDAPNVWRRKILNVIIPNNKRIIAILDKNREHMTKPEIQTLEEFRQHIDDLIARHLEGETGGRLFPIAMNRMMSANG